MIRKQKDLLQTGMVDPRPLHRGILVLRPVMSTSSAQTSKPLADELFLPSVEVQTESAPILSTYVVRCVEAPVFFGVNASSLRLEPPYTLQLQWGEGDESDKICFPEVPELDDLEGLHISLAAERIPKEITVLTVVLLSAGGTPTESQLCTSEFDISLNILEQTVQLNTENKANIAQVRLHVETTYEEVEVTVRDHRKLILKSFQPPGSEQANKFRFEIDGGLSFENPQLVFVDNTQGDAPADLIPFFYSSETHSFQNDSALDLTKGKLQLCREGTVIGESDGSTSDLIPIKNVAGEAILTLRKKMLRDSDLSLIEGHLEFQVAKEPRVVSAETFPVTVLQELVSTHACFELDVESNCQIYLVTAAGDLAIGSIPLLAGTRGTAALQSVDDAEYGEVAYEIRIVPRTTVVKTLIPRWGPLELQEGLPLPRPRSYENDTPVIVQSLPTSVSDSERRVAHIKILKINGVDYPYHVTVGGIRFENVSTPILTTPVLGADDLDDVSIVIEKNSKGICVMGKLNLAAYGKARVRLKGMPLEAFVDVDYTCHAQIVFCSMPLPSSRAFTTISQVSIEPVEDKTEDKGPEIDYAVLLQESNDKNSLLSSENAKLKSELAELSERLRRAETELHAVRTASQAIADADFAAACATQPRRHIRPVKTTVERIHRGVGRHRTFDMSVEGQQKRLIDCAFSYLKSVRCNFYERLRVLYQRYKDSGRTLQVMQGMVNSPNFASCAILAPVEMMLRCDPTGTLLLAAVDVEGRNVLHLACQTQRYDIITYVILTLHDYKKTDGTFKDENVVHSPPHVSPSRQRGRRLEDDASLSESRIIEVEEPREIVDWECRTTASGNTVLHSAVLSGHVPCVEVICRLAMNTGTFGRLYSAKNTAHKDPVALAQDMHFPGIVSYLKATLNSIYRDLARRLMTSADETESIMRVAKSSDDTWHGVSTWILKDSDNYTPLHVAACRGYERVVCMFMNVSKPKKCHAPWTMVLAGTRNENVLHCAVRCPTMTAATVIRILDSANRDNVLHYVLTHRDKKNDRPMDVVNNSSRGKEIRNAISHAIKQTMYGDAQILLKAAEHGDSITLLNLTEKDPGLSGLELIVDDDGNTVFHIAAMYGKHALLSSLSRAIDQARLQRFPYVEWVTLRSSGGDTPLHNAIQHGSREVIMICVEGAHHMSKYSTVMGMQGMTGLTPMQLAQTYRDGRELFVGKQ